MFTPEQPAPYEPIFEALPKGTVEIVLDGKLAMVALVVLAVLSLNLLLCVYRRSECGWNDTKTAVYRKEPMI